MIKIVKHPNREVVIEIDEADSKVLREAIRIHRDIRAECDKARREGQLRIFEQLHGEEPEIVMGSLDDLASTAHPARKLGEKDR